MITKKITRDRIKAFVTRHGSEGRTLDIGCQNSAYANFFPNRVGLDIKPGNGVDVVGDAHKLPFKDNEFDNVLCTEVLEHLHTPAVAVAEMARVLKDGGTLILTTRFMFPIHDAPDDYFRYTKYGLKYLFKDWEILELQEETSVMETFAVLLQRLGYQSSLKGGKLTKAIVFICARIVSKLSWVLKKGYGDIERTSREDNFMSSGYYLAAQIRKDRALSGN